MKEKLLGKTPAELREIAVSLGLKGFVGDQIAQWMYSKRVKSFDEMLNISKAAKEKIREKYILGVDDYSEVFCSKDGTKKYLFGVGTASETLSSDAEDSRKLDKVDLSVEAVMIPTEDRATVCVSCQRGCKMACRFCMTGRQGFHGNLDTAEILSQFIALDETFELSNAVFMGMGEPMDNYDNVMRAIEVLTAPWGFGWSPKRITVSSVGIIPGLKRFLEESQVHLAISVHNAVEAEREDLMPLQKAYPLRDVIDLIKKYDWSGQRRVSFEYTMFSGWNDDKAHADALARLLKGLECRVNLIRFHAIPDFPYTTTPDSVMQDFQKRLSSQGITCTIRSSRGEDIFAACGLLAGSKRKK